MAEYLNMSQNSVRNYELNEDQQNHRRPSGAAAKLYAQLQDDLFSGKRECKVFTE